MNLLRVRYCDVTKTIRCTFNMLAGDLLEKLVDMLELSAPVVPGLALVDVDLPDSEMYVLPWYAKMRPYTARTRSRLVLRSFIFPVDALHELNEGSMHLLFHECSLYFRSSEWPVHAAVWPYLSALAVSVHLSLLHKRFSDDDLLCLVRSALPEIAPSTVLQKAPAEQVAASIVAAYNLIMRGGVCVPASEYQDLFDANVTTTTDLVAPAILDPFYALPPSSRSTVAASLAPMHKSIMSERRKSVALKKASFSSTVWAADPAFQTPLAAALLSPRFNTLTVVPKPGQGAKASSAPPASLTSPAPTPRLDTARSRASGRRKGRGAHAAAAPPDEDPGGSAFACTYISAADNSHITVHVSFSTQFPAFDAQIDVLRYLLLCFKQYCVMFGHAASFATVVRWTDEPLLQKLCAVSRTLEFALYGVSASVGVSPLQLRVYIHLYGVVINIPLAAIEEYRQECSTLVLVYRKASGVTVDVRLRMPHVPSFLRVLHFMEMHNMLARSAELAALKEKSFTIRSLLARR